MLERRHIRFGRLVVRAGWSGADTLWTVEAVDESTGETETFTSRFVIGCTGYYDYDAGDRPELPDEERFTGRIIHSRHWPEDPAITVRTVYSAASASDA